MTDKEIKIEFANLHGQLFSIKQALALLIAKSKDESYDELLMSKFAAVSKRMEDDAETQSTILIDVLEARDLGRAE
jgi:hypothetical protein